MSNYCPVIPQSLYKGKRLGCSANLNQCLLADRATSLQFIFVFCSSKVYQDPPTSGSPWTHFSTVSESALSQTSGLFHSHLRSWFTTRVVLPLPLLPLKPFSLSAQTDRNRTYHTCKLSESQNLRVTDLSGGFFFFFFPNVYDSLVSMLCAEAYGCTLKQGWLLMLFPVSEEQLGSLSLHLRGRNTVVGSCKIITWTWSY